MHCTAHFSHVNHVHWVGVQCEASGPSKATPAVVEASEATCTYVIVVANMSCTPCKYYVKCVLVCAILVLMYLAAFSKAKVHSYAGLFPSFISFRD